MPKPFRPHQPEKKIVAEITAREADLLRRLRRHAFVKAIVHKADNLIIRVEINESQLIEEEPGLELEIK